METSWCAAWIPIDSIHPPRHFLVILEAKNITAVSSLDVQNVQARAPSSPCRPNLRYAWPAWWFLPVQKLPFFVRFARNKINPNHFFYDSRWPTLGFRIKITTIPVEPRTYEIVGSERKPGVLHQNPGFWKAMFFIMFEFPWSVMIFPVLWSFCLKSCLNVWKSLRNSKSCHMMRCTLAKCSTLFLHPRKYPYTSRHMFWRHTHYNPTTVRSSPTRLRIWTTVKLTENMVPGDDLLIFRGTPCKFEGCIHFSHLIFDAGLASSRKTAIGPKNPLLLAFSPGPKKPIFFLRVCTG